MTLKSYRPRLPKWLRTAAQDSSVFVRGLILLSTLVVVDATLLMLFVHDKIGVSTGLFLAALVWMTAIVAAPVILQPKSKAPTTKTVQVLAGRSLEYGRLYPMVAFHKVPEAQDLLDRCVMYHNDSDACSLYFSNPTEWTEGHPLAAYELPNISVLWSVDFYEIINLELT